MAKKQMRAFDALREAQKIALAPFIFQTVVSLKRLGILDFIFNNAKESGLHLNEIAKATNVSVYGLSVLLEMAESADIVSKDDEDRYDLTKIGYFLNYNPVTEVNLDFTHDVCYKGLFHLKEAIETGTPSGLKELGNWSTIYEGLSQLTPTQQESWFAFDHYYSDGIFRSALKTILLNTPKVIYDIGGNTGKFAITCCRLDQEVNVRIFDLPGQLAKALGNAKAQGFEDRIKGTEIDWLSERPEIPPGADIIWMSQFLDCFSQEEILKILKAVVRAMQDRTEVVIIETFTDRQKFGSAKLALEATSLYFTALANGNSKMYKSVEFAALINEVGLTIIADEQLGEYHTMLRCTKR